MANNALNNQKQRVVHVDRQNLIEVLRSNKTKHVSDYQEALLGYKTLAKEKLNEASQKALRDLEVNVAKGLESIEKFDPENPTSRSDYLTLVERIGVQLKVPRSFEEEYDAAIDMATFDVRDTLELSYEEFQCFVRDVWEWSEDFQVTKMLYSTKA